MATTISPAKLTVTHTETITLNGIAQGSTNIKAFANIAEFSKRIITVTTTEAVIATFSSGVASAGHYTAATVRYIRFTNLDDAYFITLTFRNQDNDEVAIKLDYGQSFVWNGDNVDGLTTVFNATEDSDTAFGSLTNIQADANGGDCDLEMVIASV